VRRPFIAGNWKMNLSRAECVAIASGLAEKIGVESSVEVGICPASVYLEAVATALGDSAIGLGGQDMYFEDSGAFTGEISSAMLLDVGCRYVILGHSERRHVIGESNELINKKTLKALAAGLTPIVCVGETLEEREADKTQQVIQEQFDLSLASVTAEQMEQIVIAYEPVWAIGTGKTASPEQAEQVHLDLRKLMESRYNAEVASKVRIQYGGSVKPSNAAELLGQPNIDGALVGGAALKVEDFCAIIAAAS